MMNVRLASIAALLGMALATHGVMASSLSPPDPPTCSWCDGPPPPPLLIPTVAPTEVAPISVISVKLSPTHLQRGQTATLRVMAGVQDAVTTVVQYRDIKARTFKAQIGVSKVLTKAWKIPSTAGTGKAQIKVSVDGPDGPYSTTISFEVVK
jgi:hypothetical protein